MMPNHVHGIIEITGAFSNYTTPTIGFTSEKNDYMASISPKSGSVSRIISSYKAACTSMIRSMGTPEFSWQARFHDHIIRTPQSHDRISQYILHNPQQWTQVRYNLKCTDVTP
ncbi:transposase [Pontibacter amylolyticus]